jgi:hypothetical protein
LSHHKIHRRWCVTIYTYASLLLRTACSLPSSSGSHAHHDHHGKSNLATCPITLSTPVPLHYP